MGRLDITISDELESSFRDKVAKKFGARKGALTDGLEDAISSWVKQK